MATEPTGAGTSRPGASGRGRGDRQRWDEQVARLVAGTGPRTRREPLTAERVVAAALDVVRREGHDALTMRRVAEGLGSSPGAIYAHVRDKEELDDLMLGSLCSRIHLPSPDPAGWREQAGGICRQLRDLYLEHPGLSRVALGAAPRSPETMRVLEGLLAVLTAGGLGVTAAAWTADAAFAYTAAYSVVSARRRHATSAVALERAEVVERLESLPPSLFPIVTAHARAVTSGEGHERFEFTLGLLLGGTDEGATALHDPVVPVHGRTAR